MKKIIGILSFLLICIMSYSQTDTTVIYIDYYGEKTTKSKAEFIRKHFIKNNKFCVKDFYLTGELQMSGTYSSENYKEKDGAFVYYNKNGNKSSEGEFLKNKMIGKWAYYDNNGIVIKEEVIEEVADEVFQFSIIEIKPEFPGGMKALMKFLSKTVKYPEAAIKKGIEGRVFVQFIINKKGKVVKVEVVRGVDPYLDREALQVIKRMPNWKPGIQRGKPVKVSYIIPINFKL